MQFSSLLSLFLSIPAANAVNMKYYYAATSEIPAGFDSYLKEFVATTFPPNPSPNKDLTYTGRLYTVAEDPASTTNFTDYFSTDGELSIGSTNAVGAEEILALKHRILPVEGTKHWDHYPDNITLTSDNTTETNFHVIGKIEVTFTGGNCSKIDDSRYTSEFTLLKTGGQLVFEADKGNLKHYNDIGTVPAKAPTDIPCTG